MHTPKERFRDDWRPGTSGALRRVEEEEYDLSTPPPTWSNELSFVPGRRAKLTEHDPQTQALINHHKALERLQHGPKIIPLVENWRVMDRMQGAAEKQAHLERAIAAARRDPIGNEHILVFLLIALEPVRRAVSSEFRRARNGLQSGMGSSVSRRQGQQAWLAERADWETLEDVTRFAVLEAIYRYPQEANVRLFPWFRDTVAHRAIEALRAELPEMNTTDLAAVEAEALSQALIKLEYFDEPVLGDAAGYREWRGEIEPRWLYETVAEFHHNNPRRHACERAVSRLAPKQKHTINALFFEDIAPEHLAMMRGVSRSTIDNTKMQATTRMYADDLFFTALFRLGAVRDAARAAELDRLVPGRVLADGRRLVSIDEAA